MWQILGVLVFCGLLSPSVGTVPGIRFVLNPAQYTQAFTDTLSRDDLLWTSLKTLPFSDITLGSLLGIVGQILGLKATAVRNTGLTVVMTNEKIKIKLSLEVDISGTLIIPLNSIINICAHLDINLSFGFGNYFDGKFDIVNFQCVPTVGSIELKLLSGLLPPLLIPKIQDSISSDLSKQICGSMNTVINALSNIWLATGNVLLPFGSFGDFTFKLAALPTITENYLEVTVYVYFRFAVSGVYIGIPDTDTSIALPVLGSHGCCLAIHPGTLNIALQGVIPKVPLEISNILEVFSKAEELKDVILALLPDEVLPNLAAGDLSFKITIGTNPLFAFDSTGATVTLSAKIEIFAKKADGSKISVVVVRCSISAKVAISVANSKLNLGLLLFSIALELESSSVGIIDVSSFLDPLSSLVNEAIMPVLNVPLGLGIPLPQLLKIPLVNVKIQTIVNALVICI
ncbi:BPI fold-containing family B member 4-like [Anolis carolinensis]|uniref:BPI fold-containing family B member 4-like n=1 Tax=Anolis carolinensis TaxID=28377 RepID=UPI002F2B360D